ncbi:MAG TPA: PLP-dependent aminotransferase family protein [Propionicimonas sp.]|uniref:aminotransferase-like domain-containing protein n=1 Tax=Propionicimonas sp. TaxID=1955623 RepID=UPI002F4018C3
MSSAFQLASRFAGVTTSPVRDILAVVNRGDVISFAGGIPDASLFELDDFHAAFDHVLTHQGARALQYATTRGEPELLEQVAARLSRTVPTHPDQVQVTSGSQEGIFLVGQVLIDPGDVVLVEQPTYLAAVQAFALAGARLVAVSSDDHGMLPGALAAAIAEHHPKFVYLIPTFQNPTGRSMPAERRRAVADVLLAAGVPLLEDDPYGELRFEGEAAPPLASLPGMAAQTVLLNSASKVMAPGVRVGWLRAEGDILRSIEVAKQAVGLQSAVTDQLAVARYLATCDLDAHIARVVAVYRERRDAMSAGLDRVLPDGATVTRPEGGMFLWARLGGSIDTALRLPTAVGEGVAYVPGWPFFAGEPDRSTMRLSYVTNHVDVIAEGLARLGRAFDW